MTLTERPQSATPAPNDLRAGDSVTDVFLELVKKSPHKVIIARQDNGVWQEMTASEFHRDVVSIAKGLVASGIQPGERIGLFARTAYEWTLVDFAIWYAGGVTVPFYETSSDSQLAWMIEDSGVRKVFVESPTHAETIRRVQEGLGLRALDHEGPWTMDRPSLDTFAARGSDVSDDDLESRRAVATGDDLASLIYTSGTTGRPKGCILTHGNFVQTAEGARLAVPEVFESGRLLLFIPQAHVFARFIEVALVINGSVLGHTSDLKDLLPDLASFKPTCLLAVPRVFEKVFNAAAAKAEAGGKVKATIFRRAELASVAYSRALDAGKVPFVTKAKHALYDRLVYSKMREVLGGQATTAVSGGGPLGEHLGHYFRGVGLAVLEGYGLTETTAPVTVNVPEKSKIGTVGPPLPGCAVAIDTDGEVLTKGVSTFHGYWQNEEATQEAFTEDGWFKTGDLGSLDADGYLKITGRKKETLVTSGGKNVAPAPLEDQLRRHAIISQAMVVGDNRKFISALIMLDPEMLPAWLKNNGLPGLSLEEAAEHPQVIAAVQSEVDKTNTSVSHAEAIKKFAIVPAELTEAGGDLSAKQSLKRHVIYEKFAKEIDALYS